MSNDLGLYEFNALAIGEQFNLTHNQGTFIDVVIEGNIKYVLYSLYKFWVQITYDAENNEQIGVKAFITGDLLDRFSGVKE